MLALQLNCTKIHSYVHSNLYSDIINEYTIKSKENRNKYLNKNAIKDGTCLSKRVLAVVTLIFYQLMKL
jgi:hypothetical protein